MCVSARSGVCARARIIAFPHCLPTRAHSLALVCMAASVRGVRIISRVRIAVFNKIGIRLLFGRGRTFYAVLKNKNKNRKKKTTSKPSIYVNSWSRTITLYERCKTDSLMQYIYIFHFSTMIRKRERLFIDRPCNLCSFYKRKNEKRGTVRFVVNIWGLKPHTHEACLLICIKSIGNFLLYFLFLCKAHFSDFIYI